MRWEGAAKRQGGQAHCWQPGVGSRAWGSKHCRGWEGSWSNRSSQRSRTEVSAASQSSTSYSKSDLLAKRTQGRYVPVIWCEQKRDCFVISGDALLVHLIRNAVKMAFWICIWACAIVLTPLNSHVIQWNCRRAHSAPVTSCVSHLEQSVQRGANGRTALLCLIDNEPLTSIILFQSGPATIQSDCRKWRFLPLKLSLNHHTS